MERKQKMLSIYPIPALSTPLPLIPFIPTEVTKGANKARRNQLTSNYWVFVSCFTVWVIPSSNDIMILIKPFIPSFEISKVNLFPVLTTPSPITFFKIYLLHFRLNCLLI